MEDEVAALCAIYGEDCHALDSGGVRITLRSHGRVFRVTLSPRTQGALPTVSLHGSRHAEALIMSKLERETPPSEGALYWCAGRRFVAFLFGRLKRSRVCDFVQRTLDEMDMEDADAQSAVDTFGDVHMWEGECIKVKKSKFVGYAGRVSNAAQGKRFVEAVKYRGKNVLNATHVISAWRLASGEQQRDDDGETGAGDKLLHLLDVLDEKDCVVVVVRWFGGTLLGPDRFKIIADAAQSALNKRT